MVVSLKQKPYEISRVSLRLARRSALAINHLYTNLYTDIHHQRASVSFVKYIYWLLERQGGKEGERRGSSG